MSFLEETNSTQTFFNTHMNLMAAALKEGKEEMAKKVLDLLDQNPEPKQDKGKIRREASNAFKGLDEETTVKCYELLIEAKILGEGDLATVNLRVSRQYLNTKAANFSQKLVFVGKKTYLTFLLKEQSRSNGRKISIARLKQN